jgi:uncharacterized protein (TIGR00730 family)
MNICVYGAASNAIHEEYLRAGEELGALMAKRGHRLVFGGGANGLMGAVARGVYAGGGEIVSVVPSFFNVDGVLFAHCNELIYTETMRERKRIMEERADAFIVTPGGVGTYDEFFEMFTLLTLGRHQKPIAILNTRGYYNEMQAMLDKTVREGFMTAQKREMVRFFDEPAQLLDYLG